MKKIKLFEAFAGVGSQYYSLKNILKNSNISIEIVGQFEWFVDAIVAYETIHHDLYNNIDRYTNNITEQEMQDFLSNIPLSINSKEKVNSKYWKRVKNHKLKIIYSAIKSSIFNSKNFFDVKIDKEIVIKNVPEIDILTYSFPCQDLSLQGLQKGMNESFQTRSSLLWQIDYLLSSFKKNNKKMPKILILENVANIISNSHRKELLRWLKKLNKYGYINNIDESNLSEGVLNSKNFGSIQNRKRFFCISYHKDYFKDHNNLEFNFSKYNCSNKKTFKNIMNPILNLDEKEKQDQEGIVFLNKLKNYFKTEISNDIFTLNKNSNVMSVEIPNYTNFHSERILYHADYNFPTLTASGANSRLKYFINESKDIRIIHPLESWKLMGFDEYSFSLLKKINFFTDSKLRYLAGNSISIEVLNKIFSDIYNKLFKNKTKKKEIIKILK